MTGHEEKMQLVYWGKKRRGIEKTQARKKRGNYVTQGGKKMGNNVTWGKKKKEKIM